MHNTVIHRFRRDLRLTDNTALHHATKFGDQTVPAYILSGWQRHHLWTGNARQKFLCGCLEELSKSLDASGSRLIIRRSRADEEIIRLVTETQATADFTNRDPDPFGKEMQLRVAGARARLGVEFHSFKDCVLHEPDEVLTGEGKPYRIYTPYSRNWAALAKPDPLPRAKSCGAPSRVPSLPLPTLQSWSLQACDARIPEPGETAATERLTSFVEDGRLARYGRDRNIPEGQTTSMLSQYLRFGLISIRELYARCHALAGDAETISSKETYIKELAWREFYVAVLHHWPTVLEGEFNDDLRNVPWESDERLFEAWQRGQTGFPIVDAGMRQILATGWMHNRVRMIAAMFLTKDLSVHWRLGERFFMQELVDGEIASNNDGWQWSAGTGADAAPYFRIQNPWTQTKRYDPEGRYIKSWIPDLAHLPVERFFAPPDTPLHPDYPLPIVDHAVERERTLARFKLARKSRSPARSAGLAPTFSNTF